MKKPKKLPKPDWSDVERLATKHIEELAHGRDEDDMQHYIYEEVLETIYGPKVWNFINREET